MASPTYFFALSDEGISHLSHQLGAIALGQKRRSASHRRRSGAARSLAIFVAGIGLLAAAFASG